MQNSFIDTHAHVVSKYYDNISVVFKNAKANNINKIINCSYDVDSALEVISIAEKYDDVCPVIGIHPGDVDKHSIEDLKVIDANANKCIAIGEIGLDYHYGKDNIDNQKLFFKSQLDIAKKHMLPVVIHSRDATLDTLNILKEYNLIGVIHSFSGSLETARDYIKLGYLLGINGVVTFKNSKLKECLKEVPLESIVLETDCPYLTPEPYRGKKNEPAYIKNIAEFVAGIYNVSLEELSDITNDNVKRIFEV